ncbi:ATP:ADP antiporter, AAA family [Candidatus Magnetomoraceae bacterium gMMP-15]
MKIPLKFRKKLSISRIPLSIPLRSHEKKPFWYCFAINFCFGLSFILSGSVSEALFLKDFGVEYLPLMFVLNAVIVIIIFPVYDYFTDKLGSDKIFYILSAIFIALILPSSIILFSDKVYSLIYPCLLIVSVVSSTFYYMHYCTYLVDFFDTLQTKRLLPFILSAIIIGIIIGGFSLPVFLAISGGIGFMLILWIILLLVICVLVFLNQNNRTLSKALESKSEEEGFFETFKSNITIIKKSKFVQITLLCYFIGDLTVSGAEIISQNIFAESPQFPDAESLTKFYGVMGAWASIVMLFLQFVVLPRLIRYWGVTTLNLILPTLFLISLTGLLFTSFLPVLTLPFAIFIWFNVSSVTEYLEPVASNLILSALAPRQKKKMLSFYGGFAEPLGPVVIGLLLTGLSVIFKPTDLIFLFILLAGGYLGLSIWQNRFYTQELVNLLQGQNFDIFKAASEGMKNLDPKIFSALTKNLDSDDEEKSIVSAQIMANMHGPSVFPEFIKIIHLAGPALQAEILEIFARLGESEKNDPKVLDCAVSFINHEDSRVRQNAIQALDVLDEKDRFTEKIALLMDDIDLKTSCLAAVYLLNRRISDNYYEKAIYLIKSRITQDRQTSFTALRSLAMLRNDSPNMIQWILILFKEREFIHKEIVKILRQLFDKSENLNNWLPFLYEIRSKLTHPIREVRLFALNVLHTFDKLTDEDIALALGDRFDAIRVLARQAFFEKNSLDTLSTEEIRELWNGQYNRFRWESILFMEVESRTITKSGEISELIYIALLQTGKLLAYIVCLEKLNSDDIFLLLRGVLKDQFDFALKTSIRLIEFIGKDPAFTMVRKSLESKNSRLQSDAIETLENIPSKEMGRITALLEPLLSHLPNLEKIELLRSADFFPVYKLENVLAGCLGNEDPWERAIALYAVSILKKEGKKFSPAFHTKLALAIGINVLQNRLYTTELIDDIIKSDDFDPLKITSGETQGILIELFESLEKNLVSNDNDKATVSAQILADMRGTSVMPLLCRAMPDAAYPLQSEILQIFARMGDEENITPEILEVIADVMDKEPAIRYEAVLAINSIDKKSLAADRIMPFLKEPDPIIGSIACVYCLNRYELRNFHDECMSLINKFIRINDRNTALSVIRNIAVLKNSSPYIIQWLLNLLKKNLPYQKQAAKILQKLFDKTDEKDNWLPFIPNIHEVLNSPVREARLFAFMVLKEFEVLTEKELVLSLGDRFEKIRNEAHSFVIQNKVFDNFKPEQIKALWQGSYNRFLWQSVLFTEAESLHGKKLINLINISVLQSVTLLHYWAYIGQNQADNDDFLLLHTMLFDHFCFARDTAFKLFELINDNKAFKDSVNQKDFSCDELDNMRENFPSKGIQQFETTLKLLISETCLYEKEKLLSQIYSLPDCSLDDILNSCLGSEDSWEKEITLHAINSAKEMGKI